MLTNYPGLDDMYYHYYHEDEHPFIQYGSWVNAGWWGTLEGRAILMYAKLDKYPDIYRAGRRAMDWAEEFRMDAPMLQCGANTHNYWSDRDETVSPVSVMIDNLAVPAATIRGLFDYTYTATSLKLTPHIPVGISQYSQAEPILFGNKRIYIRVNKARGEDNQAISRVLLNGEEMPFSGNTVELPFEKLAFDNQLQILYNQEEPCFMDPICEPFDPQAYRADIPEALLKDYDICLALYADACKINPHSHLAQFAGEVVRGIRACGEIRTVDLDKRCRFRPMTERKKEAIFEIYDVSAKNLLDGFKRQYAYEYENYT